MTPKKRQRRPTKTAAKTAGKPALIPRPNGGALYAGGVPGNKGGLGVTPSVLRDVLRGTIAERTTVLTAVMDGECVQKTRVKVSALADLVVCADCGKSNVKPRDGAGDIEVEGMASASPSDRVRAFDTAAKYGLGALKEVSVENVRERLTEQLALIRKAFPKSEAEKIIEVIKPAWRA